MNKYRVTPYNDLKKASVRFTSVKHLDIILPALDAGWINRFAQALGIHEFVRGDLNFVKFPRPRYNTVTSFEVIEHLQNSLFYLQNIYNSLSVGGILYLTTPVRWIFKGKYHFHEFNQEELEFCLKEVGFHEIEIKRIQAYNLSHFGIRPLIRKIRDLLFGQCFLIKATK
jgi:SAM-dependent methyltransferase